MCMRMYPCVGKTNVLRVSVTEAFDAGSPGNSTCSKKWPARRAAFGRKAPPIPKLEQVSELLKSRRDGVRKVACWLQGSPLAAPLRANPGVLSRSHSRETVTLRPERKACTRATRGRLEGGSRAVATGPRAASTPRPAQYAPYLSAEKVCMQWGAKQVSLQIQPEEEEERSLIKDLKR